MDKKFATFLLMAAIFGNGFTSTSGLTSCKEKIDLVVMVDSSFSITDQDPALKKSNNWRLLKDFLIKMFSKLPLAEDQVRASLIMYGTQVETVFHLNHFMGMPERTSIIEKLPKLGGNTNTSAALRIMNSQTFTSHNGDRDIVNNVGLLITDGVSNIDPHLTIPEARKAKASQIKMFTVGIGDFVHIDELHEIASDPIWYHHFVTSSYTTLDLLIDQILLRVCTSKTPPTTSCDVRADLAVILDASGSIREDRGDPIDKNKDNWKVLLTFTKLIIESLEISNNATRVALVRFSDKANVEIYLDDYTRADDILSHVDRVEYLEGATNTSGALRVTRDDVFRASKGDRPNVRNIGIVITDGESNVDEKKTIPEAMETKKKKVPTATLR